MAINKRVCLFCGKEIHAKTKSFHATLTGNYICEPCVRLCYQGMNQQARKKTVNKKRMTPKEIKTELDKQVIGQEEAKTALAVAVYNHYKRLDILSNVKIAKSNVLLVGPTGSGKTLLAQTIASLLDVPFAIADCTSITEAGFVGDDVETVLLKLYLAAGGDVAKAERGIVFLDEVDKLAKVGTGANITKDPSGEGVQQALLKLMEGTVANIPPSGGRKMPNEPCIQMNTENILFICGGAFPGLEEVIQKRTKEKVSSIGFGAKPGKTEKADVSTALKQVCTDDLLAYGLIPEFIGRVPVIVPLEELNEEMLVNVLTKPKNSLVKQYQELFKYDGVELEFTEEAVHSIAAEAITKKTGARGLRGIMERILKPCMYEIPSDPEIEKCIVGHGGSVSLVRQEAKAAC